MKYFVSFFLFLMLFVFSIKEAQAIVVIIPVLLIPIVKIVALIIGALATPVISMSAFYLKLKKKPIILGIFAGVLILIIFGVIIAIGFKLVNPNRPLY